MPQRIQELVKALFQVAWADDVVSPSEVHALMGVMRGLGLPLSEVIHQLDQNLTQRPTEEPLPLDQVFGDRQVQLQALQTLMTVCFADGVLHPQEVGYLEGLIIRMGVNSSELEMLRQNAVKS